MTHAGRDHLYTFGLAEKALSLIKAHLLPGDPPSFEIWYTYAGRFIPALNQAINDAMATHGRLSAAEIDRIYDRHLGTFRLGEQVEKIAGDVGSGIDRAAATIDAAIGSAARYDSDLSDARVALERHVDSPALQTLVDRLATRTHAAADENRSHKAALQAVRAEIELLRSELEAVRFESRTDALTALVNRKQFDHSLFDAIAHAAETSEPLTLLLCDVDHFKNFNDTWGHPIGDDVLRLIARAIREVIRQTDVAARYGGEEFAIVLPNTDLADAMMVAERLRTTVNQKEIIQRSTGKSLGRITVSSGLARWRPGESMRELVERADACLYAAKHEGRNKVVWQLPEANDDADKAELVGVKAGASEAA